MQEYEELLNLLLILRSSFQSQAECKPLKEGYEMREKVKVCVRWKIWERYYNNINIKNTNTIDAANYY